MKTKQELQQMDDQELISEVLQLQEKLKSLQVCQFKASLIHSYHFSGAELLKIGRDRMLGSGVILAIYDLSGKFKVRPVMIKDGLSNTSINALLDDMQYSYDNAVAFKPMTDRL